MSLTAFPFARRRPDDPAAIRERAKGERLNPRGIDDWPAI